MINIDFIDGHYQCIETPTTLYIAGPMTGVIAHNFPRFNRAAKSLRVRGFKVINPAELEEHDRFVPGTQPWDWYLRRDIKFLVDCDGVALLPRWWRSKGARLEAFIAWSLGLEIRRVERWLK